MLSFQIFVIKVKVIYAEGKSFFNINSFKTNSVTTCVLDSAVTNHVTSSSSDKFYSYKKIIMLLLICLMEQRLKLLT